MSDEVGVNVERIQQLASALDNLRDVLAANVPIIVNTMNGYWSNGTGQPVNLLPLQQAVGKSADDASATTARAQMAVTYQDQADPRLPHRDTVNIPWDGSGFGEAGAADPEVKEILESESAANLASELAAAEKNPDPATARAQIQSIERQLQANSGNKTFLAEFWSQPGAAADAANLASVLSQEDSDGSSLSKTDRQILSGYAGSLAAACRLGALDETQGKDLVDSFTAATAKNQWSAAMLLSSGPSGAAYGTAANGVGANLLTGATEQILQQPSSPAPKTRPDLTDILTSGEPAPKLPTPSDYAALNALLRVDTQNTTAAQQVMAGYNPVTGRFDAKQAASWAASLMSLAVSSSGVNPQLPDGPFLRITAKVPPQELANFFNAATSGPRVGSGLSSAQFSTRAAYNIVLGTPDPDDANESAYAVVPGPVRASLLNIFGRYLPDLGASSNGLGNSGVLESNGVYQFRVSGPQLSSFIRQIAVDPEDAGTLQGALATAIGNAYGTEAKGIWNPFDSDLASSYAALYGDVITQEQNLKYGADQARDARNAELNTLVSIGESAVTPLLPDDSVASAVWGASGLLFPLLPTFPTTSASTQAGADLNTYADDQYMLYWPMVQGLINQGVIPPPAGQNWYTGKPPHLKVIPDLQFQGWVDTWKTSNGPNGGFLRDLPGFNGPTGHALNSNTYDNQTLETAFNTFSDAMELARQAETEEGN